MSDPRSEYQLIGGFWSLEDGRSRWTRRHFAVLLPAPEARQGAALQLQFFLPPQALETPGPVTLDASIGDVSLGSETFTSGGSHSYTRPVDSSLLARSPVPVLFQVDKVMKHTGGDRRELGVIVTSVALLQ